MDHLIRISTILFALALGAMPGALPAQETAAPARTPDVHFVPTAVEVVKAMLDAAKVNKQDLVYDLGCGDGRIVITAVKRYGARRGVCVDIDPARIKESRRNADTAGVAEKIEFMNAKSSGSSRACGVASRMRMCGPFRASSISRERESAVSVLSCRRTTAEVASRALSERN